MQINLSLTFSKCELSLDIKFFRETIRQNITEDRLVRRIVGRWNFHARGAILGMLKNTRKYEYFCNN